jgi:hypothetical protein
MPALTRAAWLVLLTACEGPTLYVGELEFQEFDAGTQDASEQDEDDAGDARSRDAQLRDGRSPWCDRDDDCRDPDSPHCYAKFGACVGCEDNRHCKADEYCDLWVFQCRDDPNGHKDDPGPPTGGAP